MKGDTVFYTTNSATVRASVQTIHRDDSVTVEAKFFHDPLTGKDLPGYLGFKLRLNAEDLRATA